jgi:5-methylcytosine-specific restriction protein A
MSKLTGLHEAVTRLDAVWAGAADATGLSREQLVAVEAAIGVVQRRLDAVHADVAAGIAYESRVELGAGSLAKEHGYRTAAKLLEATGGISHRDASRLVAVGEATAPRTDLLGARLPARYELLREALAAGELGIAAAGLIVALLDRCRVVAGAERIALAEEVLAARCAGMGLDDVRKLLARAEAWLDPDGVQPKEEERRAKRSCTFFERDGMVHLHAVLDAETAAPVVTALRGHVSAVFAARQDAPDPDAPDADRRTVAMIQADALALFCAHVLGCDSRVPLAGATMIVRLSLDNLRTGTGTATVDGLDTPVSVGAARRMAAGGGIIPWVFGSRSEILDWGREKRLFTRAQRLALAERDGGCAMCGLPPGMTKAHHIAWWDRDHGPTDLSNGVLLCESCHHRIHDNGWDLHIHGTGVTAHVWFIPPAHVDPARTPRTSIRHRFDIAA